MVNLCDCGVFLLHYVEKFLEKINDEEFLEKLYMKNLKNWFVHAEVDAKRYEFHELFLTMEHKYKEYLEVEKAKKASTQKTNGEQNKNKEEDSDDDLIIESPKDKKGKKLQEKPVTQEKPEPVFRIQKRGVNKKNDNGLFTNFGKVIQGQIGKETEQKDVENPTEENSNNEPEEEIKLKPKTKGKEDDLDDDDDDDEIVTLTPEPNLGKSIEINYVEKSTADMEIEAETKDGEEEKETEEPIRASRNAVQKTYQRKSNDISKNDNVVEIISPKKDNAKSIDITTTITTTISTPEKQASKENELTKPKTNSTNGHVNSDDDDLVKDLFEEKMEEELNVLKNSPILLETKSLRSPSKNGVNRNNHHSSPLKSPPSPLKENSPLQNKAQKRRLIDTPSKSLHLSFGADKYSGLIVTPTKTLPLKRNLENGENSDDSPDPLSSGVIPHPDEQKRKRSKEDPVVEKGVKSNEIHILDDSPDENATNRKTNKNFALNSNRGRENLPITIEDSQSDHVTQSLSFQNGVSLSQSLSFGTGTNSGGNSGAGGYFVEDDEGSSPGFSNFGSLGSIELSSASEAKTQTFD